MKFGAPGRVRLGGVLGAALDANRSGRLTQFVSGATSPPIALFDPAHVRQNHEGDWYGEHAGKWLYAAARAANRTANAALTANVRRVADYLIGVQDADGYLGTYAPERRFMHKQPRAARTWDGAPSLRTWDIWTHSYLVLGLLEVYSYFPERAYLAAAQKIGDLCWRTLTTGGVDITELGNHFGMSATVFLDPAVELYFASRDEKYLDLAKLIVKQADERPELALLSQALAGVDASEIATGKVYQLCWNIVGVAKLYKATGEAQYLSAVRHLWENVRTHHLTLGGGPWGGVGHRSREVFNHYTVFSPYGYVETCSTLAWIQLNRELLGLTGEAKYAEEIERSAYNDLLGAQAPNGEDWCYYSFPNGERVHTTYWRCCKSSGAIALEELPPIAYSITAHDSVAINLYGPGEATLRTAQAGVVQLEQATDYPFDGAVRIRVNPERPSHFAILLRIPTWAGGATLKVNAVDWTHPATPGAFVVVEREWRRNDEITLQFPMAPMLHRRSSHSVQESKAPDGAPIRQEVMRYDHVAITRGPLVYATGLIDGFKSAETIRMPDDEEISLLELVDAPSGYHGPAIRLNLRCRDSLTFLPYYEAGGRTDGAWRLTWMQVVV
ncbi:MAG: glycoside hydrolase family 127 protein [Steroidobacter sp.]